MNTPRRERCRMEDLHRARHGATQTPGDEIHHENHEMILRIVTVWTSVDAVVVTAPVFPSTPPHWRDAPLAEDAARSLGGFPWHVCSSSARPYPSPGHARESPAPPAFPTASRLRCASPLPALGSVLCLSLPCRGVLFVSSASRSPPCVSPGSGSCGVTGHCERQRASHSDRPNLLPRVVDPPHRVVALRSWRVHWVFAVRGQQGRSGRGDSTAGDVERHKRHNSSASCGLARPARTLGVSASSRPW